MDFRHCPKCERDRHKAMFLFRKRDGTLAYHTYCETCRPLVNQQTNAKNKSGIKQAGLNYVHRNPDKVKITKINSRAAREYQALGALTVAGWFKAREAADWKCLRCGSTQRLVPDHVVPLARGGTNTDDNIQCLCFTCNSWKQDRLLDYRVPSL